MAIPLIRRENYPNLDTGSTYPITVSSAFKSFTVGGSIYTTGNNISTLTAGH
jgi:hypothetical protein